MTKREQLQINQQIDSCRSVGINYPHWNMLRHISMTLRRWYERECNGEVERDEKTRKPYAVNTFTCKRSYPIPDRESGAEKRLATIMKEYPSLTYYLQTDPRGCALYIIPKNKLGDKDPSCYYSQYGIAIY